MVLSSEARDGAPAAVAPGSLARELERIAAEGAGKITAENFPVALRVLPRRVQDHLRRPYVYARLVQDVGEDAAAGRVYLPSADLQEARVGEADLRAAATSPQLRRVIARQVARSERLLAEGDPLVRQLHGWARLAVLGYVAGGRATAA